MKRLLFYWVGILMIFAVACTGLTNTISTLPASEPQVTTPVPSTTLETAMPASATPVAPAVETSIPSPTTVNSPVNSMDDEQFDLQLAQAVEGQDFDTLRSLMKERFSFATWNTELLEISSEEALQRMADTYLASGSTPQADFSSDIPALLGGADPLAIWGPIANPVRALHITGLGPSSSGEAVLIIGKDTATQELYWHGLLVPQGTAFQATNQAPGDVVQTDVQYVRAKEDLNVRSGPGENYAVEGLMRSGEVAQVTGKSLDGVWWQIICTSDASGHCWISAIPDFSEPVDAPER